MSQDPFYESIVSALGKSLDSDLFELCVCDLLSKDFPGIAPIHGGKDAGMDGAIPDSKGEPYPLVCTTGADSARNLRDNLRSYSKAGGSRRNAVFATSRFLQPAKIRGLYATAQELGFILIQVFDGQSIALKLYHRPDWCKRLLDLTGNPPALSIIPKTRRPIIGENAIGRSEDIEWLKTIASDRILVGQPGSGKTFLLHLLARGGWGLFAVSEDRGELANAIRSERPAVIIVDDAHVDTSLLEQLVHLRRELEATYHLVATCWLGSLSQIRGLLGVNEDQIRILKPLSRDTMVKVIRGAGLQGSTALIREIVTQSVGKPGLAVTISNLCMQGGESGIKELLSGELIARETRNFFIPIMGADVTEILASFAIGGKAGMPYNEVSRFLSILPIELRHRLADLSQGGVIQEGRDDRISVIPEALGYFLVKEAFFTKPAPLKLDQILPHVISLESSFRVLVGAKAHGANVDPALLPSLVREIDTANAWELYSQLGPEQAREALENRPQFVEKTARIGLFFIPEFTIPFLLNSFKDDESNLNATPEHPLRQLQDWIKMPIPGKFGSTERRRVLLVAARRWVEGGGDVRKALHVLSLIFNPSLEWTETDPGAGLKVTVYSGILSQAAMQELYGLWPEARQFLKRIEIQGWPWLLEMLESLIHPHVMGGKVPYGVYKACMKLSKTIIEDLANLARDEPGVLARLKEQARIISFDLDVQIDPDFIILYPTRDIDQDWKVQQAKQKNDVEALAVEWNKRSINCVVDDIMRLEKAARAVSPNAWSPWPKYLCKILSDETKTPGLWIESLIGQHAPPSFVEHFLDRCAEIEKTRYDEFIEVCLSHSEYMGLGVYAVLKTPNPKAQFIKLLWDHLGEHSDIVETMVIRKEIPEETIKLLLEHYDTKIVEKITLGIWEAAPSHEVMRSMYDQWRKAIIRIGPGEWLLPEILQSDPSLAFDWLKTHLATEDLSLFRQDEVFSKTIASQSKTQKQELLSCMQDDTVFRSSNIIRALVGDDIDLYRTLLSRKELKAYHLKPLERCPESILSEMAKEANAHYDVKIIARGIFGSSSFWHGKASDYWKRRLERYERWKKSSDYLITQIAAELVEMARSNYQIALEREYHEEVFGFIDI